MLNVNFIWIALVIAIYGNLFYIRDTFRGETKPNRVTYFLWGVAPLIAFFSQKSGGGGEQIIYTLVIALLPLIILATSFLNKKAYWKLTRFDIYCGVLSLVALVLLLGTNRPLLALAFSIAADFMAALPTIIKSFKFPDTETISAYSAEIFSSIIVLLTIHNWIFVNYFFAAYILFMCIMFTSLLAFSPNRKNNKTQISKNL